MKKNKVKAVTIPLSTVMALLVSGSRTYTGGKAKCIIGIESGEAYTVDIVVERKVKEATIPLSTVMVLLYSGSRTYTSGKAKSIIGIESGEVYTVDIVVERLTEAGNHIAATSRKEVAA